MDWKAFAAVLDDIGYDGALSVGFEAFAYYNQVLEEDPARAAALTME